MNKSPPSKRRRRWPLILAAILLVVFLGGWFWLNSFIRSELQRQLSEVGIDSPQIGSVWSGLGGFTARDVRFQSGGSHIELNSLEVHQAIWELAGAGPKDEIRISGGRISIDVESLSPSSTFSLNDIDLSQIDTVAKRFSIENLSVAATGSDGKIQLDVEKLSLIKQAGELKLSGSGTLIDGAITLDGSANQDSGEIQLTITGDQLRLVDQQWHQWPLVGAAVKKHIAANAVLDLNLTVEGTLQQGLSYEAEILTDQANLFFAKFQLPIAIRSASISIADGLVTYRDVQASLGDQDVVHGKGSTSFGAWPSVSKFEGDFSKVDVADLRKLVPKIPRAVTGTANGKASGSVDVNAALETTLRLSASGDTNNGSYGQIDASHGFVDVQIQPLVLSPKGKTLDLQGSVVVKAKATQQDADDVLETFGLDALDEQFEFETHADGDVDLLIPLASAGDLRTWNLSVLANTDTGSVGQIPLRDIRINTYLRDGQLVFDQASARLANTDDSGVSVSVTWPLPNAAADSIAETGSVSVIGNSVPPNVALGFFDRQMANAKIDYSVKSQIAALERSEIDGSLDFQASIRLPSGRDRPVESWNVEASVYDSKLTVKDDSVDQIHSAISIREGVLSLSSLSGNIRNGGKLNAESRFNLRTSKVESVSLSTSNVPASWLANAIIEGDSSGKFTNRTSLNLDNVAENLKGTFAAKVWIDPSDANNFLWKASSEQLLVFGKPFSDINAAGHYDGHLDIEKIVTQLPGGGIARLEGDWIADMDEGKFQLRWKDAQLAPLLNPKIVLPKSFAASSDGELKIAFAAGKPIFDGLVDLVEPKMLGGTFADHHFKISTRDQRIHFRDIPSENQKTISLDGSLSMSSPFEFSVHGHADSMPLSTAMFDKLSGSAKTDFKVVGEASPWRIKSTGGAQFDNVSIDNKRLSKIQSQWRFDSDNPSKNEIKFLGLGGNVLLDSQQSDLDTIRFRIKDIELSQFALFQDLPVELAGSVTGTVSAENWLDPDRREMKLTGKSQQIRIGSAKLSNVQADASLTDAGILSYVLESQWLEGKLSASGEKKLDSLTGFINDRYPLKLKLTNARLKRLAESMTDQASKFSKQVQGRISASMDLQVTAGKFPEGSGQVSFEDVKYQNRLASRSISSPISLSSGILALKRIRAELQQGEITGKATIPVLAKVSGAYELDVRNFNLARLLYVLVDDPVEANGVANARLSGRIGRTISGSGTLGVSQAGLFGSDRESLKIPVRYQANPSQGRLRIEMPNSRIKAFRGTIEGAAKVDFGSQIRFESKLELSSLDSQSLLRALSGYQKPSTGKLSGKLDFSARNFRSAQDLKASFRGELDQSNALSFPLLDRLGRFLGNAATLRNDRFNSDAIDLELAKGRIEVRQFRLQSALVSILVTGDAWLNGKLDLEVAARVEPINQPTLIEQLAGSPITRAAGPEVAFFAQAAEFLSERIIFVDVTGTAQRPQLRFQPGKQLKEEAIRYFLRGSQILPNTTGQNN